MQYFSNKFIHWSWNICIWWCLKTFSEILKPIGQTLINPNRDSQCLDRHLDSQSRRDQSVKTCSMSVFHNETQYLFMMVTWKSWVDYHADLWHWQIQIANKINQRTWMLAANRKLIHWNWIQQAFSNSSIKSLNFI